MSLKRVVFFGKTLLRDVVKYFQAVTSNKFKMSNFDLVPPSSVRNMTILEKDAFVKIVSVPTVTVNLKHFSPTMKKSKKYMLKLKMFNPVLVPENNNEARQILLNPELIHSENDVRSLMGVDLNEVNGKYSLAEVTINYDNWSSHQILDAVLPDDSNCSGFSIVGHIIQLNLREHLLPYKKLIAQVFLDKNPNVTLVVNKTDIIDNSDNTFRSFSMEKLAGETDSTETTVKENGCTFKFDFAKVYWNSRLSSEHERIAKKLKRGDVLFDVMAGVGPFAIQAAKRKCLVYANDLNPASYEALINNCRINKVSENIQCYQMDGQDFIKTVFKDKFVEILKENDFPSSVHITMNLPSIAIDFLPSFIGLYEKDEAPNLYSNENLENCRLPVMHVYLFSYNETEEYATHLVASRLGYCFKELDLADERNINTEELENNISSVFKKHIIEVVNVRRVAPGKVMFRVSFYIPKEKLISIQNDMESRPSKRLKT